MEWVCGLEDLDVNDRALAGGKGANLGAMLRAGLPVPGGFVVLTTAYREFVEHNRLRAEIEQIAAAANGGDVASLDKASDALRALFERGAIPPELEGAITGAYERLGGRVAVRSSASAEDLPEASFAGQQESYLNVERRRSSRGVVRRPTGELVIDAAWGLGEALVGGQVTPDHLNVEGRAALLGAVKRCWSSLFTARALSYRAKQGVGEEDLALAVDEIPPVFKVAAGRIYVDVTAALAHPRTRRIVFGATSFLDQPTQRILEHVVEREAARLAPERPRLSLRPSPSLPLIALCRAFAALVAPERSRRKAIARAERAIAQLDREAAAATEPEARRRFLHDAPTGLFGKIVLGVLPTAAAGLAMRFLAERQLERWLGDASGLQPVLRSLPHNPTTEMDLVLWRLAQRALATRAAAPGRRCGAAALVREVRQKQGRVRSLALRFMLSRVRALAGMREVPKFFLVRAVAVARRVLGGLGRELAAAGQLDDPDDVYFLRSRDVKGDLRPVASTHRAHYQRELARRSVPRVITSEGETFFAAPAAAAGALEGVSASVGVYEGPVRVIREPRGASLEPGEVLVAPGTDPAWTPLFLTAGALVMEIGGIMSHGSVVAREYGIPAVVGVPDATTRLRTGQRVRVDGEAGTVLPLD